MASSASPISKNTIQVAKGVPSLRAGRGQLVPPAPAALAHRHRSHRRIPAGALHLQLRGHQGRSRLQRQGQVPDRSAVRQCAGVGLHLSSAAVSRAVRVLHLVSRRVECRRISLDRQLAVHLAALDRLIAFVYIVYHTYYMRFTGVHLMGGGYSAAFWKVQHEFQNPWAVAAYVIGIIAASWHFSYGLWLFAAKWGITVGEKARKKLGLCLPGAGGAS